MTPGHTQAYIIYSKDTQKYKLKVATVNKFRLFVSGAKSIVKNKLKLKFPTKSNYHFFLEETKKNY